jgi:hypothetical protein
MRSREGATIVAVGLALYGIYIASYVPGLLIGTPPVLILLGFVAQTVLALCAAVGVWRGHAWAPGVVVLLGMAVAVTELFEGPVLGLISLDHALGVGVLAILLTLVVAAYVRSPRAATI